MVVAARHLELGQRVALKFLLPHVAQNETATARFLREARAAVKVDSEHVARVLDVGRLDTGLPFLVMEYLEGHDLSQHPAAKRCRSQKPLSWCCRLVREWRWRTRSASCIAT